MLRRRRRHACVERLAFDADDPHLDRVEGLLHLLLKPPQLPLVPTLFAFVELHEQPVDRSAESPGFHCELQHRLRHRLAIEELPILAHVSVPDRCVAS